MRDFLDAFGADSSPAQHVCQKRTDVVRSLGAAEGHDEHGIEHRSLRSVWRTRTVRILSDATMPCSSCPSAAPKDRTTSVLFWQTCCEGDESAPNASRKSPITTSSSTAYHH